MVYKNSKNILFEYNNIDKIFYEKNLQNFLPDKIVDIHTHVWLDKFNTKRKKNISRVQNWPSLVAKENSIEDLIETNKIMFPGKKVVPLIFTNPTNNVNFIDEANEYVMESAKKYNFPSLIFSHPHWSAEEFESKIVTGNFLGAKVYLSVAEKYLPEKEIRIFDYLPHHQLEILNKHKWIVMLHIPRDGRLKDPVNLSQMIEIEKRYPDIKVIIAHVGRAYCIEDVGNAFEILAETKNMMFDFSANTNSKVFEQLINAVGTKRILFGSDLPIARMRMKRICENGRYINLVPKGMYGDVSNDIHMREITGDEANKLTFFMYEEIDAFRRAAEITGLSRTDIEDIFYNNAIRILGSH